jgi:hypothetical protein
LKLSPGYYRFRGYSGRSDQERFRSFYATGSYCNRITQLMPANTLSDFYPLASPVGHDKTNETGFGGFVAIPLGVLPQNHPSPPPAELLAPDWHPMENFGPGDYLGHGLVTLLSSGH